MRTLPFFAAIFLASPAFAANHEISLELGTLSANDADWHAYTDDNTNLPSTGLRIAYAFHPNLSATASAHILRRGALLFEEQDNEQSVNALYSAFLGRELTLGLHADTGEMSRYFVPYANIQALLVSGRLIFDGDRSREDNLDYLEEGATSLGVVPSAGLEVRLPKDAAPFTVAVYAEGGWAIASAMRYDTLGDQEMGGFFFRSGAGVRF